MADGGTGFQPVKTKHGQDGRATGALRKSNFTKNLLILCQPPGYDRRLYW